MLTLLVFAPTLANVEVLLLVTLLVGERRPGLPYLLGLKVLVDLMLAASETAEETALLMVLGVDEKVADDGGLVVLRREPPAEVDGPP